LTHLQWLVDLRNEYVHSCSIYTGYSERIDETEVNIQVKSSGQLSLSTISMTYIHTQEIQNYANGIVELIGSFVDQTDWYEGWFKILRM
jgi:hypothetical protein